MSNKKPVPDLAALYNQERRKSKNLAKYLRELTGCVRVHIQLLDAQMAKPNDPGMGKRVALMLNTLEFANDSASHFGLGEPLSASPAPGRQEPGQEA